MTIHHGEAIANLRNEDGDALTGMHFTFVFECPIPEFSVDSTDEQVDRLSELAAETARQALAPFLSYRVFLDLSHVDFNRLNVVPLKGINVWDDSVPPGGYVCSVCRIPTETEPCPEHQGNKA